MKIFVVYLKDYFRRLSFITFISFFVFTAVLVWINYTIGIERRLRDIASPWISAAAFAGFYGLVLFVAWTIKRSAGFRSVVPGRLKIALVIAACYFAIKMVHWDLGFLLPSSLPAYWDRYALIVLQVPAKLLVLLLLLWWWRRWEPRSSLGFTTNGFDVRPYLIILAGMVPLVVLASTRADFLHTYPKVQRIAFLGGYVKPLWPWQLMYEISYGLDFLNIELFFRGFLVLGIVRYAGEAAVLPMACFYCTIHFGKPLGECISSFFGGLALGVLSLRSGSILGGLMVHLGIAWLMEAGGWIGHW